MLPWIQILCAAALGALFTKWLPDMIGRGNAGARLEQRVTVLEVDLERRDTALKDALKLERERNNAQDSRLGQLEVTLARIEGKLDALIHTMESRNVK